MIASPLRRFFPVAAGVLCLGLASCSSTNKKSGYAGVVDYTTPQTNLSQEEYPFDEQGNYLADVVSGKKKGRKNKPIDPPKPSTDLYERPPEPTVTAASTSSRNYEIPPASNPYAPVYSSGSTAPTAYQPPAASVNSKPKTASSSASKPTPKPRPQTTAKAKPTPKPKPKPKSSTLSYTVKRGDTLYGLANRYGTSVAAIKKASGISSDLLRDGRTIKIPRK